MARIKGGGTFTLCRKSNGTKNIMVGNFDFDDFNYYRDYSDCTFLFIVFCVLLLSKVLVRNIGNV